MSEKPARKLAGDEAVRAAIKDVLRVRPQHSQQAFAAAVRARLSKGGPCAVSDERIRRLAARSGVRVTVSTRTGPAPKACPGCGGALLEVLVKNLAGKAVRTGMRCDSCGFRGSDRKLAPGRYGFSA